MSRIFLTKGLRQSSCNAIDSLGGWLVPAMLGYGNYGITAGAASHHFAYPVEECEQLQRQRQWQLDPPWCQKHLCTSCSNLSASGTADDLAVLEHAREGHPPSPSTAEVPGAQSSSSPASFSRTPPQPAGAAAAGLAPPAAGNQPGDTLASPAGPPAAADGAEGPPRQRELVMVFTCEVCDTRCAKSFSRRAYNQGVVLVRCPGCNSLHLVADHLGWFGDSFRIEDLAHETGGEKTVKKVVGGESGEALQAADVMGWTRVESMRQLLARRQEASGSQHVEATAGHGTGPGSAAGGPEAVPGSGLDGNVFEVTSEDVQAWAKLQGNKGNDQ